MRFLIHHQPREQTEPRCVRVGIVVTPGVEPATVAVRADVEGELKRRFQDRDWMLEVEVDRLAAPSTTTTELVDAARHRLLDEDWDLALMITDAPLRRGHRAISEHSSPTHRVGVVSLPALGALNVRRRLRDTLTELLCELVEYEDPEDGAHLHELADVKERPGEFAPLYALRVLAANLRLLGGMIRANRPWRFALHLYRVLVTALATAVFALITGEVWQLADALGAARLTIGTIAALVVTATTIILAHGLWERAPNSRVLQDVVLFNVATLVTVTAGIVFLYLAMVAVTLAITALFVAPSVLASKLGHEASLSDFVELAWLISSIATVGGALGSALETEATIREAAYAPGDEDDDRIPG